MKEVIKFRRPKRIIIDETLLRKIKIQKIMENKYWKPIYTEEEQHLCMNDTSWKTDKLSWDYLNMTPYLRDNDGQIVEYFTITDTFDED